MGELGVLTCPVCEKHLFLSAPRTADRERLVATARAHLSTHDVPPPERLDRGGRMVDRMRTVYVRAGREDVPDTGSWIERDPAAIDG